MTQSNLYVHVYLYDVLFLFKSLHDSHTNAGQMIIIGPKYIGMDHQNLKDPVAFLTKSGHHACTLPDPKMQ